MHSHLLYIITRNENSLLILGKVDGHINIKLKSQTPVKYKISKCNAASIPYQIIKLRLHCEWRARSVLAG